MRFAEDGGSYSTGQLDTIVKMGGGLRRGKSRQDLKSALTLEIAAVALSGFAEGDVGVVRDNARQLKFNAESTGFEE